MFFRDGKAYKGTWAKESADEPLRWLDEDGEPFPLRPGQTWIEILPTEDSLETKKGKSGEAGD